jgi:hypothetical protein
VIHFVIEQNEFDEEQREDDYRRSDCGRRGKPLLQTNGGQSGIGLPHSTTSRKEWRAKLRRSAISVATNAPWSLPKLRSSVIFVRRLVQIFFGRAAMHWNHEPFAFKQPGERLPSPHPMGRGIKGEGFMERL